jgi:Ca-activated chloride channel family protein
MKKLLFLVLFAFTVSLSAKTITGKVSDPNSDPLFGATVQVKGTKTFTTTDFDGNYSIEANATDALIFTYSGYESAEVKIKKRTTINVTLTTSMDEIIVMGYRDVNPSKSSISQVTITTETIQGRPNASFVQHMQGQMAGLNIGKSKGQPGANSLIQLRGVSSIKGNTEPIFVLDGQIINESNFRNLNPDNIKEITTLRDTAATSIYGNRGANGVIVISTTGEKQLANPQHVITEIRNLYNQESYKEIEENSFENVTAKPLSTFSIDVDKASYSNVRRMINNGEFVNPHAVKIEEMVNYFKYDYSEPTGKHPFNVETQVIKTPWNEKTQLVKIGLQGKNYDKAQLPPSNLTFLIDVSGSMSAQNKLPLLKKAFKLLVSQLREQDRVSIVVYAGAAGMVLPPTAGNEVQTIFAALENLSAGGSTAGGAGIELAYKLAQENFKKKGNNRVILATDGDFNVGASSNEAMEDLIVKKRESGVFLSVLGFGMGNYQDDKLEILADKGNGNHAYIDTMQEAQNVFVKEFSGSMYAIAKDVKLQVEFNPNNVSAYRLIGYENRMLATEDFIDDKKDAGELGMGHTVTALYEIVPKGVDSKYLKEMTELKYTNTSYTTSKNNELFTVKLRYKQPDGDKSIPMEFVQQNKLDKASEDMNFASAVAMFGMHLRKSAYANNASLKDIIKLAENGRGKDDDGYRAEFIRLVKSYQQSDTNAVSFTVD